MTRSYWVSMVYFSSVMVVNQHHGDYVFVFLFVLSIPFESQFLEEFSQHDSLD